MTFPNSEPTISVGIVTAPEIKFRLPGEPERTARPDSTGNGVECDGECSPVLRFAPKAPFELIDVPIGIGFHWQRNENQLFSGQLRIIADQGKLIAINDIGLESYLKSVISSEMSANASEALLRAHAVVSRSWLLRQLHDVGKHPCGLTRRTFSTEVDGQTVDELCCWHDREDHTLFDVCADDHCQRYQGLTRQTSPAVEAAVDATRGMVLTYGDEICDARFSKCCGGRSETFGNCWEDASHPYLEAVDDPFCDTTDTEILDQVLNGYDREAPDFYRWEAAYTPAELSGLIARRSGVDFGDIEELRPLTRGQSGRIVRLLVRGSRRTMVVGKELEIRRWLSESHLRSSNFEVTRDADGRFILRGRGWGHGVGLCQIGAAVMGAKGYSAHEILHHYFPKSTLTKIYE